MWGFKAVSGDRVGGGLYAIVRLEPDEEVLRTAFSWYSTNHWFASDGYITLTNRRLIFTGERLRPPPWRRVWVDVSSIETHAERRTLNPDLFIGCLGMSLVVTTYEGRRHYIWPFFTTDWTKLAAPTLDDDLRRLLGR